MDELLIEKLDNCVLESLKNDEIPVGAVIFDKNNKIISFGINNRQKENNILGHAEINAILMAEKEINDWRLDGYSMLVNLEPCNMCSIIIKESRLDKIYYFLPNKNEIVTTKLNKEQLTGEEHTKRSEKYKDILSTYFKNKR